MGRNTLGNKAFAGGPADSDRLEIAEYALRESEEKYRTIIHSIEDGYYEVDLAGNFTYFNDAMVRITGFPRSELLGMNNRQLMDDFNAKRVFEVFNQVYLTGLAAKAFDWELIRKDGSRCTLEVSVSQKRNLMGEPNGFMGIARDITQRRRMEQALRESEEKYRTIIENIEDGYYEVDLAGNFTFFNAALSRIAGYPREILMGMNNRQIMDEFNAKRVFEVFNTVYMTGIPTRAVDWELIRSDGSKRTIEVSVSLRRDLNARPVGFMGIARDITDRKQAEKTLRAREEELQNKTRNLEEVNTALKVLLKQREEDRRELEETVMTNLSDTVLPHLDRVRTLAREKRMQEALGMLKDNLEALTSPFSYRLSSKYLNLTSTEIEIANLVKQGKTTKEIADLMKVSNKTIEVHRLNIRKKLGLSNQKMSLRTHLLSIR